ncbi:AraC-type DNA-binding protein [Verrucomicrobium sp. GAS474]|uniref:helix-turn-helix domain-containing protein n=1 Tax=Verrucomicrobium sp. GAS474 TaxID=1882831 RepID=UPI00087DC09E|nr:AraC family transcriptional regulator [Verrucomicrobium sp. GAS474]SDU02912.1 AraC-type DNA-binding protein [Verrucomicrobium sp. GAS474]
MLTYLASGERSYDRAPQKPWPRESWELMSVTSGKIRLSLDNKIETARGRTLWVIPPGLRHSWLGDKGRSAEIVVFHLDHLAAPIGDWVKRHGWIALDLTSENCARLQELHRQAEPEWLRPGVLTSLRWSRLGLDLAILIGELAHLTPFEERKLPGTTVEKAMTIFSEHLNEGWTLDQVSAALAISSVHLRRLFRQVLQSNPQQVFENIRLTRAKNLMMLHDVKLEEVAVECGYQNGAILSRAFKRRFRVSPSAWKGKSNRGRKPLSLS